MDTTKAELKQLLEGRKQLIADLVRRAITVQDQHRGDVTAEAVHLVDR